MGGDVHRDRDQAERGEDDPDVPGDVVVVGGDPTEVRVRGLPEHAGEDEHGDQWERDQADGDHRLADHQAQLESGEAEHGADRGAVATAVGRTGGGGPRRW